MEWDRKEYAVETLREALPPGSTVSTVLRHVTRSGMSRSVSLLAVKNDQVSDLSSLAARATTSTLDRNHGGVKVGGCGMDAGFHLVYTLGRVLYPDGFPCTGDRFCPSNDHSNDRTPDYNTPGRLHSDGGYALKHRWI